jgi:hypothetical protein
MHAAEIVAEKGRRACVTHSTGYNQFCSRAGRRTVRRWFEDIVNEQLPSASIVWGEAFTPTDLDIAFLSNLLLEEGAPMESERLALALIRERLQNEARRRARLDASDTIYLPQNRCKVGDRLVFPATDFLHGTVLSIRPGQNTEAGVFDVICVKMDGGEREFAAGLELHRLNDITLETQLNGGDLTPEQILHKHGESIVRALESRLAGESEIVQITGRWFPRALLVDVSPGHLNLSEAVLDVAGGGPLPTSALLEHMDMPANVDPRLAAFSLEYALYQDDRFEEVGPAGEMLWFLKRLEPPEVMFPPRRLACAPSPADTLQLTPELLGLKRDLEDEWDRIDGEQEEIQEASLVLSFPHWRVGTLPLNARLGKIFPHAHQATHIRFEFLDSENNERFSGWVVTPQRYVFGLADWYQKKGMIPGGMMKVRRGEKAGVVVLEAASRRPAREWVRTAVASPNNRLTFSMQKQSITVEYDEQSVIAAADPQAVDEIWLRLDENKTPLPLIVADVFRELAKLNPQSTVHARTLYHAVNVVRRIPPVPVFAELIQRPYFFHMGDLYYRFDEAKWTESR